MYKSYYNEHRKETATLKRTDEMTKLSSTKP
jgi:hypothetical protein